MDTPDFNEISADVIHAFHLLTVSSRLWKCLPPIIILLGKVLNALEAALIISIKITTLFKQSISARALVKKTQEPGIKLQKADFFRNDTWTSPQTNSEEALKIPLVHFFNSRWPPPCKAIFEKQGYTLISHLCS